MVIPERVAMPQYELNLRDYIRIFHKRKLAIIGTFLLVVLFSFIYVSRQPYVYEASATVKIEERKSIAGLLTEWIVYNPQDVIFPSCHASTIIENGKGLLAAWFGGTAERNPDVGIWISRFSDGRWSKPTEVANGIKGDKRYPTWNPVLFNTGKKILLFYKTGPSPSTWWGEMITSADMGMTWSELSKLPATGVSLLSAMPVTVSGAGRSFNPLISTYWKPWKVKRGCHISVPAPLQM